MKELRSEDLGIFSCSKCGVQVIDESVCPACQFVFNKFVIYTPEDNNSYFSLKKIWQDWDQNSWCFYIMPLKKIDMNPKQIYRQMHYRIEKLADEIDNNSEILSPSLLNYYQNELSLLQTWSSGYKQPKSKLSDWALFLFDLPIIGSIPVKIFLRFFIFSSFIFLTIYSFFHFFAVDK